MASDAKRDLIRGRPVERLIFGTEDEGEVGAIVERFCREALGSGVRETLFVRTSVGVVFGLDLGDGRQVVLKAHQPRQSVEFLRVVFETQSYLAEQGFPCPRPVIQPASLGGGLLRRRSQPAHPGGDGTRAGAPGRADAPAGEAVCALQRVVALGG